MSNDREAPLERLLEALTRVPLEVWYDAALKAHRASGQLPDVSALWQGADAADPVRTWNLADSVETLYYRLNSRAALKRIGGKEGCELLRRATELAVLSLAFPDRVTPSDAAVVARTRLEFNKIA